LLAEYNRSGLVEYAEPDYIGELANHKIPNDPSYVLLWGLHQASDADIDAPEAWHFRTDASSIIVAVIDTGVNYTHEDLAMNMWRNPSEIPSNGVDDDGNGYIDDVYGIKAYPPISGDPSPTEDHGTHVAGIMGALGNNGNGVVGVAWSVQIMALNSQVELAASIECIDYAISKGAHIINASWGFNQLSQGLRDAVRVAGNHGIIVVAAAGNWTSDNDNDALNFPKYPASYDADNVVAVAATTKTDSLAAYSSYGLVRVDLGAPGGDGSGSPNDIFSTGIAHAEDYFWNWGTSMAAPHVSGTFALMKAQFPTESYLQLINRVLSNTDQLSSLIGKCQTAGRLNLHRALTSTSARPPNDDFATITDGYDRFKIVIYGTNMITAVGNNVDATKESYSEPNHAGYYGGKSIWWRWTAPNSTPVTIKTKGSAFNTLLAVYTGTSVNALTPIASSAATDGCSFSQVTFTPVSGTTYRIAVDGYNGGFGTVKLTLQTSGDTSTSFVKFQASPLSRTSGQFQASLTGPALAVVTIESSPDLETWTVRGTYNFSAGGSYTYTDTTATAPMQVYRARTSTAFSCNAVGYQDQTITHAMIANPFNAVDNRVSALFPSPPSMQLYKWDDVTDQYVINSFSSGAWTDPNMTLAPGEGVIAIAGSSTTLTFKGEVLQGYLVNPIPSGMSIRASKYPKSDLISSLGFPLGNGDSVTRRINGNYTTYTYHNGIWTPTPPTINAGEAFWIIKNTEWKQNILLWP